MLCRYILGYRANLNSLGNESFFSPSLRAFLQAFKKKLTLVTAEANTGSSCSSLLLFLHPVMVIANSLYENSIKEKGRVGKKNDTP